MTTRLHINYSATLCRLLIKQESMNSWCALNLLISLFLMHLPKTKHEEVAVNILDAVSNSAWSKLKFPFIAVPTPIEKTETINAATVACTCTSAMLPTTIWTISFADDILPKFACVDSRDASVISRLPLSPSNAGTSMKSSGMCSNTSQC